MGFTGYVVGLLSSASGIIMWRLSKRYRLDWVSWGGPGVGAFLTLFTIAWCVGSVLKAVPRAASMGLIFFGSFAIWSTWAGGYCRPRATRPCGRSTEGIFESDSGILRKPVPGHL
jgi:hypothetical protein